MENGTVCAGAYVGIDVQARDFIAAEGARIDGGTLLERCFAGECCTLDKHFTAVDSLFFANSHCENGEAVSIFAGPYTVSHHKSSLLIAGMFSFFNAGSGQPEQPPLQRAAQCTSPSTCGDANSAAAPTSWLRPSKDPYAGPGPPYAASRHLGVSVLLPGGTGRTFGTDAGRQPHPSYALCATSGKWLERDRRTVKRDRINFEEYNPIWPEE